MKRHIRKGFTIIELMVVISIMGILAAVILANLATAAKRGRDAQRQSDLRNLQTAIESYKHRYGYYPAMGCTDTNGNGFSDEGDTGCVSYISNTNNFVPNFITKLPHDPSRNGKPGYAYVTNDINTNASNPPVYNQAGEVYKIMAMNTVEADNIFYDHPFKSCDVRYGNNISTRKFPDTAGNDTVEMYGWCSSFYYSSLDSHFPTQCYRSDDNVDGTYGVRFSNSYALWGGIAEGTVKGTDLGVNPTAQIICK